MPRVLTISGTSRPGNYTAHALAVVRTALEAQPGVDVVHIDARELDLPFPGLGTTPDADALAQAVRDADAILLASPEYHGSFCAMTKLILENLGFPSAIKGKPVALLGVAAGRIGAIKSIEGLRSCCAHMGAFVLPGSVSIAGVQSLFDSEGHCSDPATVAVLEGLGSSTLSYLRDYVCPKFELEAAVREGRPVGWTTRL